MTGFATILILILVVGIALAVELLKMARTAASPADPTSLHRAIERLGEYRPMQRLFSEADLRKVEGFPELEADLRQHRRRAMRLYLGSLRRDFMTVWSACRLLAPVSDDPNFVMNLVRNLAQFHFLVAALRLRCAVGHWSAVDADLSRLTDALSGMRDQAAGLLHRPAAVGAGA